uniref:KIB1-4 beta-propeller domain-containing protein n=1 Tax=Leersia perrieri TaxID=77586 RepID=A0A0D9V3Z6_9ORYZ
MPLQTQYQYDDLIVYRGCFYMVTGDGLEHHDGTTLTERDEDGLPLFRKYLAESPDGKLMLIWREHSSDRCDSSDEDDIVGTNEDDNEDDDNATHNYHYDPESDPTIRFQAFVLDEHPEESKWREVHNFGGASIFIGRNSTMFFSSDIMLGLARDCIYFTDGSLSFLRYRKQLPRDIGMFDMKAKVVKPMASWEQHMKNWPLPIWITPLMK